MTTEPERLRSDTVVGAGVPGATLAVFQNGLGAEQVVRDRVPDAGAVPVHDALGHDIPAAFRDEMLAATDAMRPFRAGAVSSRST